MPDKAHGVVGSDAKCPASASDTAWLDDLTVELPIPSARPSAMNNGLAHPAAMLAQRAALAVEQAGDRTEMQRRLPRLAMLSWPDQQRA